MSAPRVGPWGAGGGAPVETVSCGSMERVPPSRRPAGGDRPPTLARVGPTGKRNVRGAKEGEATGGARARCAAVHSSHRRLF